MAPRPSTVRVWWMPVLLAFGTGVVAVLLALLGEQRHWPWLERTAKLVGGVSVLTLWALIGELMIRQLVARGVFLPESRESPAFKVLVGAVVLFIVCAVLRLRPDPTSNHTLSGPAGVLQVLSFVVSLAAFISLPRARP